MTIRTPASAAERLIVALDVPTEKEALEVVASLDGQVSFYKVGLQLFLAAGWGLVDRLTDAMSKRVFLDLKIDDIGETVTLAVREVCKHHVEFFTLQGGGATIRAAVAGRGDATTPRFLNVTLLSSMDSGDLRELNLVGPGMRFDTLLDFVTWRGQQAQAAGADGLIVSGDTIGPIRQKLGAGIVLVSPGIRPAGSSTDDHKRPTTPKGAMAAGADYLVVGRPIRDAADRAKAARAIVEEIQQGLD